MKVAPKGPLFFCEHCGSPVPRDAKKCPSCGRFFSSVRCPSCNFTGPESLFSEGCPMCGYSSTTTFPDLSSNKNWKSAKSEARGPVTPLPWWVYGITLLALVLVAIGAVISFAK